MPPATKSGGAQVAQVVERNIHALLARKESEESRRPADAKAAHSVTRFAGSMKCVYLHIVIYGLWIASNLGLIRLIPRFDPTFVILATTASVESLFLSTFILISQNRMATLADKRADLDLQISLLSEHEITHLIELVSAIASKLDIKEANSAELRELKQAVHPEHVLDTMEALSTAYEERAEQAARNPEQH